MAFNLNKTDQQTPKFNLSKGDEPRVVDENKRSSKGGWIIIVLLVIGAFFWYLVRDKRASESFATLNVSVTSGEAPVADDSPKMTSTVAIDDAAMTTKTTDIPELVNEEIETSINELQNSVPGNFDPGLASLHLDVKVVQDLVNTLSKNHEKKIVIEGYASSEGDITVNRQLSGDRAASFKEYLVSKGIADDRITTEGKGIENPIATNDTEEGRSKNRRVQVRITD